ncbi:hypothetical protein FNB79_12845 [Formosa sediminum]|uniref:Uncharacterized protein n=1 Tax=Formosa sediminum TaxID=2594004 RepID=A0A516GTG6_9FLAO|nr:hypothetical protein [Formosa sediminum]QDO94814.1 hypothetical protein FNB79_12845 [Formosa sediminum]
MSCINRIINIAFAVLITINASSCKDKQSINLYNNTPDTLEVSTIYQSVDKDRELAVYVNPENKNGYITVIDSKDNKAHLLKRIDSPDGITYKSNEEFILWTKGGDFTWSKSGTLITKGHLKTTQIQLEQINSSPKFHKTSYGNYVSSDFSTNTNSSNWIAITIKPINQFKSKITVRSKSNKNDNTCNFDAIGTVVDNNILKVTENHRILKFTFGPNTVNIVAVQDDHLEALVPFCNGDLNVIGTYSKYDGELDTNKIDHTAYLKTLFYNNVIYTIKKQQEVLTLQIDGITSEYAVIYNIPGEIINAEIDDLNNDTFPEILIYSASGMHKIGQVYGFSIHDEKSISKINISKTDEYLEAHSGYLGYDEFAMVEGTFIQRFPVYENNVATGLTRQIQYTLEGKHEATKYLVVDKVIEY